MQDIFHTSPSIEYTDDDGYHGRMNLVHVYQVTQVLIYYLNLT